MADLQNSLEIYCIVKQIFISMLGIRTKNKIYCSYIEKLLSKFGSIQKIQLICNTIYNNRKMNTLVELSIKDFKAIKRADVQLDGITVVSGVNGCGKSTFAKIISGYYMNYFGKIKVDGEDLKKIPGNMIRSRIVYINQNDFLFDASSKENCTLFFSYDVSPTLVSAMESEELLEKDYSTTVMSGGERQKIAFLRGFSKKSDILICDEAESAMDILAKKRFIELLKKDKERINVSITHTINDSLKEYDRILYFKHGVLVEQGSFDELYSKKKEFYKFYCNKTVCMTE